MFVELCFKYRLAKKFETLETLIPNVRKYFPNAEG